jgi:hypothetical protein
MVLLAMTARKKTHAGVADARPDHYFLRRSAGQWLGILGANVRVHKQVMN